MSHLIWLQCLIKQDLANERGDTSITDTWPFLAEKKLLSIEKVKRIQTCTDSVLGGVSQLCLIKNKTVNRQMHGIQWLHASHVNPKRQKPNNLTEKQRKNLKWLNMNLTENTEWDFSEMLLHNFSFKVLN